MKISSTLLDGVFEIENTIITDNRGIFVKSFHSDTFSRHGLETVYKESFYSVSKKNVIRGMHFQLPPDDHAKLVYVVDGEILDVVVDIRRCSSSFGKSYSTTLSDTNGKSLYIASGFAHGFLTKSNSATVVYMTTSVHSPKSDTGIHWNSFGFEWAVKEPIISERDSKLSPLQALYE